MSFAAIQEFPYDEHLILYHKVSNQLYALNDTGQLVWRYYKKGLDKKCIANILASEFLISKDLALKDVEKCLSAWRHTCFNNTPNQSEDYRRQIVAGSKLKSISARSEINQQHR